MVPVQWRTLRQPRTTFTTQRYQDCHSYFLFCVEIILWLLRCCSVVTVCQCWRFDVDHNSIIIVNFLLKGGKEWKWMLLKRASRSSEKIQNVFYYCLFGSFFKSYFWTYWYFAVRTKLTFIDTKGTRPYDLGNAIGQCSCEIQTRERYENTTVQGNPCLLLIYQTSFVLPLM